MNVRLSLQFRYPGPSFPTLLRPVGHPQNSLKFWLVGWLVSRSVGWLVSRSVGQSRGSHTNVTLPLQFFHLGPPFPTLLRPAGHPQNSFKFWAVGRLVGRLVSQGEVTRTSCCLFSFVTRARPSRPFYALQATPKTVFNFGWLVGRSVGWLVGWSIGHREVTRTSLCLFSFVTLPRPSRPFYALRATPKTALSFGWLVDWLVGQSRGSHTNVMLPLQFWHLGPAFLTLRATPKRP
jgi:hypothetical protein